MVQLYVRDPMSTIVYSKGCCLRNRLTLYRNPPGGFELNFTCDFRNQGGRPATVYRSDGDRQFLKPVAPQAAKKIALRAGPHTESCTKTKCEQSSQCSAPRANSQGRLPVCRQRSCELSQGGGPIDKQTNCAPHSDTGSSSSHHSPLP